MKNEFTPGPWEFSKSVQNGDVCFDIFQSDKAKYTPYLSDVAYCRVFKTYANEYVKVQEANARLLAAAPDLLEALKDAYPYIHNESLRKRIGSVISKSLGVAA